MVVTFQTEDLNSLSEVADLEDTGREFRQLD